MALLSDGSRTGAKLTLVLRSGDIGGKGSSLSFASVGALIGGSGDEFAASDDSG